MSVYYEDDHVTLHHIGHGGQTEIVWGNAAPAPPTDLARVGLGGRLRALADAPDPLEAPGTALGRAYRPYVTSGTVPTLNGAVAACHVCRGETGTPCHPDPTEGDQA